MDHMNCGECGNDRFFRFGPYDETEPDRLVWIYTCTKCGNQIREFRNHTILDCYTQERRRSILIVAPDMEAVGLTDVVGIEVG